LRDNVTYRLACEEDLSAMRVIQGTALHHLAATSGRAGLAVEPITDEPSFEMRQAVRTDPTLAWLAIGDGRPIGFSVGFVRGELWFLSDLFVLPEAQGMGAGAELLQRCLSGGIERGARVRAVVSSGDPGAQVLYIRAGMVPRFPLFRIKGAARGLKGLAPVRDTIRHGSPSKTWIRRLGELDEMVWGRRRDGEHRFWLSEFRLTCLAIADTSGGLLGYGYYEATPYEPRRIGPLAARTARLQLALLRAIGDELGGQAAGTIELHIPGINMTVLSALLGAGFKIDYLLQFMSSHTLGHFDRYLPSGGTLL
jgi:GNAT superfamily N-acetyltransferase